MSNQSLVGYTTETNKTYIPELGAELPNATQVYNRATGEIVSRSFSTFEKGNTYRVRYVDEKIPGYDKSHSGYYEVARDFKEIIKTSNVSWNSDEDTKAYVGIKDNFQTWHTQINHYEIVKRYPDNRVGKITWKQYVPPPPQGEEKTNPFSFTSSIGRRHSLSPSIILTRYGMTRLLHQYLNLFELEVDINGKVRRFRPSAKTNVDISLPDNIWGIQAKQLPKTYKATVVIKDADETLKEALSGQTLPLDGTKQINFGNRLVLSRPRNGTSTLTVHLLGDFFDSGLRFIDSEHGGWEHYDNAPNEAVPPGYSGNFTFAQSFYEVTKEGWEEVDIEKSVISFDDDDDITNVKRITQPDSGPVSLDNADPVTEAVDTPDDSIYLGSQSKSIVSVGGSGEPIVIPAPAEGNVLTIENDIWVERSPKDLIGPATYNRLGLVQFQDSPQHPRIYSQEKIDELLGGVISVEEVQEEAFKVLQDNIKFQIEHHFTDFPLHTNSAVIDSHLVVGGLPNQHKDSVVLELNVPEDRPKGFLPPVLSTNQRDEIFSPPDGLHIYNKDKGKTEVFVKDKWEITGADNDVVVEFIYESKTIEKSALYLVDTSSGPLTVTLPGSDLLYVGFRVDFVDVRGTILSTGATGFGLNNFFVQPNPSYGQTIHKQPEALELDRDNEVVGLIYAGNDEWRIYRSSRTGAGGTGGINVLDKPVPLNNHLLQPNQGKNFKCNDPTINNIRIGGNKFRDGQEFTLELLNGAAIDTVNGRFNFGGASPPTGNALIRCYYSETQDSWLCTGQGGF